MTVGFIIKIILEVLVVFLIAYGIMNEEKLIAFEEEFFPLIHFCIEKYVLKKHVSAKKNGNNGAYALKRHDARVRVVDGSAAVRENGAGAA